jgi:hypothetical protein
MDDTERPFAREARSPRMEAAPLRLTDPNDHSIA